MVNKYLLNSKPQNYTYVEISHNENLSITGDLTIEFWLYLRDWPYNWTDIISKFIDDRNNEFCFRIKNENLGQWYHGDGRKAISPVNWFPKKDINLGEWTQISCVRKIGEYGRIYFNGALLREKSWVNENKAVKTTAPLMVMASPKTGRFQNGILCDLRIWSIARSLEDINDCMHKEPSKKNGLIGYWIFNKEDKGGLVSDRFGNNHGKLYYSKNQHINGHSDIERHMHNHPIKNPKALDSYNNAQILNGNLSKPKKLFHNTNKSKASISLKMYHELAMKYRNRGEFNNFLNTVRNGLAEYPQDGLLLFLEEIADSIIYISKKLTSSIEKNLIIKSEEDDLGRSNEGLYIHTAINCDNGKEIRYVEKNINTLRYGSEYLVAKYLRDTANNNCNIFPKVYLIKKYKNNAIIFMEYLDNISKSLVLNDKIAEAISQTLFDLSQNQMVKYLLENNISRKKIIDEELLKQFEELLAVFGFKDKMQSLGFYNNTKLKFEEFNKQFLETPEILCHNEVRSLNMSIERFSSAYKCRLIDYGEIGLNSIGSDLHLFFLIYYAKGNEEQINFYKSLAKKTLAKFKLIHHELELRDIYFNACYYAICHFLKITVKFNKKKLTDTEKQLAYKRLNILVLLYEKLQDI